MPDKGKKFHEFALKSALFKGRNDWYYCYLKSERIAHVLLLLQARSAQGQELDEVLTHAVALPEDLVHLCAGELGLEVILAQVFVIISGVRLAATAGALGAEQAAVVVREYEQLAERLVGGSHPSPFVAEDFFVPELVARELPAPVKDIKDTSLSFSTKGQSETPGSRATAILGYIKEKKSASIKDIARVVPGVSEKTIQRELAALIDRGLIRRIGERRWSQYTLS